MKKSYFEFLSKIFHSNPSDNSLPPPPPTNPFNEKENYPKAKIPKPPSSSFNVSIIQTILTKQLERMVATAFWGVKNLEITSAIYYPRLFSSSHEDITSKISSAMTQSQSNIPLQKFTDNIGSKSNEKGHIHIAYLHHSTQSGVSPTYRICIKIPANLKEIPLNELLDPLLSNSEEMKDQTSDEQLEQVNLVGSENLLSSIDVLINGELVEWNQDFSKLHTMYMGPEENYHISSLPASANIDTNLEMSFDLNCCLWDCVILQMSKNSSFVYKLVEYLFGNSGPSSKLLLQFKLSYVSDDVFVLPLTEATSMLVKPFTHTQVTLTTILPPALPEVIKVITKRKVEEGKDEHQLKTTESRCDIDSKSLKAEFIDKMVVGGDKDLLFTLVESKQKIGFCFGLESSNPVKQELI